MAKIKVMGNAVVFQSEMKLEDIELVKKYRPDALCVKGGADGEEILFVCTTAANGCGDIDNECVVFGGATLDDGKKATVTKLLCDVPGSAGELKELLADKIGAAVTYMNQLEAVLPTVIEEVKAERAAVMEAMEIG